MDVMMTTDRKNQRGGESFGGKGPSQRGRNFGGMKKNTTIEDERILRKKTLRKRKKCMGVVGEIPDGMGGHDKRNQAEICSKYWLL